MPHPKHLRKDATSFTRICPTHRLCFFKNKPLPPPPKKDPIGCLGQLKKIHWANLIPLQKSEIRNSKMGLFATRCKVIEGNKAGASIKSHAWAGNDEIIKPVDRKNSLKERADMPRDQLLREENRQCLLSLWPRCLQKTFSQKTLKCSLQPKSNYQIAFVKEMTFHALSTQKFRYSVDLSLGKTPDVVTSHTGLHGFCLLLAKKER